MLGGHIKNIDMLLSEILGLVQGDLSPEKRNDVARILAANRAKEFADDRNTKSDSRLVGKLLNTGIAPLGQALTSTDVARIVSHLQTEPVYAAHVPVYSDQKRRSISDTKSISHYGSYNLESILLAPGVLELALRGDIIDLAADYLEAVPYIYSVHAWWTFGGKPTPGLTHGIHRDQDDYKFLSLFVYLTDVNYLDDGPTIFYPGTHNKDSLQRITTEHENPLVRAKSSVIGDIDDFFPPRSGNSYHLSAKLHDLLGGSESILKGPAGSAFIADTFGFHSGTPPVHKDRLVLWIRYGLSRNSAYQIDKTKPIELPDALFSALTPRERETLDLLVLPPSKK